MVGPKQKNGSNLHSTQLFMHSGLMLNTQYFISLYISFQMQIDLENPWIAAVSNIKLLAPFALFL